MHYMTVQDMIWLNLQLTKKEQKFDVEQLEEATFLQFAYHGSNDLAAQAANFLSGFHDKAPFKEGNEACAFIGALAFVEANGLKVDIPVDKGMEWLTGVWADPTIALGAIKAKLTQGEAHAKHGVPDFHEICETLIERYGDTLEVLASAPETEVSYKK